MATHGPNWAEADALARRYGDAFYLFDPEVLRRRVAHFRSVFRPDDLILYPYKVNPHPAVLDTVHGQGLGAEVCSARELAEAADRRITGELLHATGCGRSAAELRDAANAGATVIIDDPTDIPPLAGTGTRVGLRVDFPIGGRPAARFGSAGRGG